MFKLICTYCKQEFSSKSSDKKFCSRECFHKSRVKYEDKKCPICGEMFHPESPTQKYCSHKCLGLAQRAREEKPCLVCGKLFYSTNNGDKQKYCSKECYTKAQTTVQENACKNCGQVFRGRKNDSKFCSKSCQFGYYDKMPLDEKLKILENLKCNTNKISKVNKNYKKYLETLGFDVSLEFQIEDRFYDLKIGDTLIEINPYPYHNSTRAPMNNQGNKPKQSDYHYNKLKLARDNGYRCIMVWDWDDVEKITYLLDDNKETLYARNCELKQINYEDCHNFFEQYHLQGDTKKDKNNIYVGLYYNNELVECMSFGIPRYNKKYEWEILRLCSHKNYKIVGGANRIFKKFLEITKANSVISYCDMSKFDGKVYESLGFNLLKRNKPSKHWYNIGEEDSKKHITDNMLRQYGYDKLFNENFGKGTSNDELMKQRGYVEIFDCGQSTFVWQTELSYEIG